MSLFDKKYFKHIDWLTVSIVVCLVLFGTVALASVRAVPFDGTEHSLSDYIDKFDMDYLQKHITNFIIGVAAMLIMMVFDYSIFKTFAIWGYIAIIALLLLLFVFGKIRGGARGWFVFDNIQRALQPGELCKMVMIIMLSKFISEAMDRDGRLLKFRDILIALGIMLLPFVLIMIQPDYGTAAVCMVIAVTIMFVARIKWIYVIITAVLIGGGLPLMYFFVFTAEQQKRINVFLNPGAATADEIYHVNVSQIAIGSGQLTGKGFFNEQTLAQLRYIPARHTDFIFSGIAEASGFIGGAILILLFFVLIFRWIYVAYSARDNFGRLLVTGVTAMLAVHVFENIGMTMGIMPVTGIPLPFISYGGSNMLTNLIGVGIVLNVYMHRPVKRKRRRDKVKSEGKSVVV